MDWTSPEHGMVFLLISTYARAAGATQQQAWMIGEDLFPAYFARPATPDLMAEMMERIEESVAG